MSHENLSPKFQTRFNTNRAEQPQKMARGLKPSIIFEAERKALISCMVSHDAANIIIDKFLWRSLQIFVRCCSRLRNPGQYEAKLVTVKNQGTG